jgi:predicted kinase
MSQLTERIVRVVRPSVIVLCGPAGCGKSTFASKHFKPTQVISSDSCRALVCDDERDQRYQGQTFALLNFLVSQRLSINRLCVVDSTALTPAARKGLLDLARKHQVRAEVFLFNIPIEKCLERDRLRDQAVGSKVIQAQFELFKQVRTLIGSEAFDQIQEFQDEDLDNIRIEILYRPIAPIQEASRLKSRAPSFGSHKGIDPRC